MIHFFSLSVQNKDPFIDAWEKLKQFMYVDKFFEDLFITLKLDGRNINYQNYEL